MMLVSLILSLLVNLSFAQENVEFEQDPVVVGMVGLQNLDPDFPFIYLDQPGQVWLERSSGGSGHLRLNSDLGSGFSAYLSKEDRDLLKQLVQYTSFLLITTAAPEEFDYWGSVRLFSTKYPEGKKLTKIQHELENGPGKIFLSDSLSKRGKERARELALQSVGELRGRSVGIRQHGGQDQLEPKAPYTLVGGVEVFESGLLIQISATHISQLELEIEMSAENAQRLDQAIKKYPGKILIDVKNRRFGGEDKLIISELYLKEVHGERWVRYTNTEMEAFLENAEFFIPGHSPLKKQATAPLSCGGSQWKSYSDGKSP